MNSWGPNILLQTVKVWLHHLSKVWVRRNKRRKTAILQHALKMLSSLLLMISIINLLKDLFQKTQENILTLNNFSEWCRQRNARFPDQDQCPEDLITKAPYGNAKLCHWLCRFVAETRQKNGAKYPATTVYQLLCGLNRFMPYIMTTEQIVVYVINTTGSVFDLYSNHSTNL